MATTKTPRAKTGSTTKPRSSTSGGKAHASPRRKSRLALAGEDAQRGLLLQTLKDQGWSLTRAAEALAMAGPSDVLRSIKSLGLSEEYDAAKARGDVKPGPKQKASD